MDLHKSSRWLLPSLGILACLAVIVVLTGCAQNTPEAIFNRGYRALEEGDVIGASLYFEEYLEKYPDSDDVLKVYNMLANCHIMLKDFGNARAVFQEVRDKFPDNPAIVTTCDFQIGRTYFDQGNFKKAEEQFSSIIDGATDPLVCYDAHKGLAATYAKQSQTDAAVQQYKTMRQIAQKDVKDPTTAFKMIVDSFVGEADVYKASREYQKARDVYNESIPIIGSVSGVVGVNFEKQNARFRWAHTWAEAGDYISAATTYDHLLDDPLLLPNWKPQVIKWKIQTLERLLQEDGESEYSDEEIAVLVHENRRLTDEYPDTPQGKEAMVKIAVLVKDSTPEMSNEYASKALEKFEKEITEPTSPQAPIEAMFSMADMFIRLGKLAPAKEALERVKKSYSNIPEAVRQADSMLGYIQQREELAKNPPTPAVHAKEETSEGP